MITGDWLSIEMFRLQVMSALADQSNVTGVEPEKPCSVLVTINSGQKFSMDICPKQDDPFANVAARKTTE